ncbi:hypothetical protein MCHI_003006 [Candidatus Magnetoovum chiemensis]|nr:hypothetical protein MCHI_003006 [Candidatus Magnetoovum chiemensis]
MILHPGVLALSVGAVIAVLMTLYASLTGFRVIRYWDYSNSSQYQLELERKTYLISTVMNYVMAFETLSLFLFVYTLDSIHDLFIGAMCATGSLNANPIGWYALYTKITVFFLCALFIAVNYIDQKAEDYPLVKHKYKMLLFLTAPFIFLDAYLQFKYFLGLEPEIISSCCGSLFGGGENKVASSIASAPIKATMIVFYGSSLIFTVCLVLSLILTKRVFVKKYILATIAIAFLLISIVSIISFISIYYYEIPTHHCPFDILQGYYHFVGYAIYGTLFGAVIFALLASLIEKYKKLPSLKIIVERLQRKYIVISLVSLLFFVAICSWPVVFSDFNPF